MKINITGKNIDITSAIRAHIESKLQKLEKWHVDIIGSHCTFSEEPGKQMKFEAVIKVPKGQLVASAIHHDLYIAINEVAQKLERQLNKLSHKSETRRHEKPHLEPEVTSEEETLG